MNRTLFRGALALAAGSGLTAACLGSSANSSNDAGLDAGVSDAASSSGLDARVDGAQVAVDAGAGDATSGEDAGSDAATPDAGPSSPVGDGGLDAVDAAPILDDAGCPVPTGVVADPTDAGIPSSGLALWLRSDMGVDTLLAAGDGGAVCRWEDVSGNAQSFTPASATPPRRVFGALGAAPAIAFSATSQNLARAGVLGIAATSARTVAVYARTTDTTTRWEPFFQGEDNSAGTYFGIDANTFDTAGGREGVYVTNNSYDADLATTTDARSHILSISSFAVGTALPGALTYDVDGTVRTLTVANANGANLVQDFSSANFTSVGYGAAGFTGGVIGEVIVYNRELSAAERSLIEQHFATRF